MKVVALLISLIAAELFKISNCNPDQNCVERAFEQWQVWLTAAFPHRTDFTHAISSSRLLFDELLNHKFTSGSFKDYCYVYSLSRREFNRCSNSIFKQMVLSGFGLADYICVNRVYDFAAGIPCLQDTNYAAYTDCFWFCSRYSNSSKFYKSLLEKRNRNIDVMPYMAGDCSYLSCLTQCRKPIIKKRCGDRISLLEEEALHTVFSTSWDIYEPPEIRDLISRGFPSAYPNECRKLASFGRGFDDTLVTVPPQKTDDRKQKFQMTRVVFALSTDGFSTSPVTCSFENQLHGTYFGRFCSSMPGFPTFTKVQHGTVYVNMSNLGFWN